MKTPRFPTARRQRFNIQRDAKQVEKKLFQAQVEREFVALKKKIDAERRLEQAKNEFETLKARAQAERHKKGKNRQRFAIDS